jgi:hypothetical protein
MVGGLMSKAQGPTARRRELVHERANFQNTRVRPLLPSWSARGRISEIPRVESAFCRHGPLVLLRNLSRSTTRQAGAAGCRRGVSPRLCLCRTLCESTGGIKRRDAASTIQNTRVRPLLLSWSARARISEIPRVESAFCRLCPLDVPAILSRSMARQAGATSAAVCRLAPVEALFRVQASYRPATGVFKVRN